MSFCDQKIVSGVFKWKNPVRNDVAPKIFPRTFNNPDYPSKG